MASPALPAPRTIAPDELSDTANARFADLTHAARQYGHWALHVAYARIRAATPPATDLLVDVDSDPQRHCSLVAIHDRAGDLLWSPHRDGQPAADRLTGIDALLGDVVRWRAPHELPGWTPQTATGAGWVYRANLHALPPAVDPDLGAVAAPEVQRYVDGVIAALAVLLNTWTSRTIRAVGEYARGVVEGWFPPLTDITRWDTIPASLGHPVPTLDTLDQLPAEVLDDEDWMLGIGSVHGLAAGVLESADTGDTVGQEDSLHVRVAFYTEDLTAQALTVAELATVFRNDVRLTAAVILQALHRLGAGHRGRTAW
jgi:hypothetical protein